MHEDWETEKIANSSRSREVEHWLDRYPEYEANWVAIDDTESGSGWIEFDTGKTNNEFVVLCQVGIGFQQGEYTALRAALEKRITP